MQRVSWSKLRNTKLVRHPVYQQLYDEQKNVICNLYHNYSDFIKIKYMNFGSRIKQGKIYSVKIKGSLDIAFTPNIYPYHLAKSIHHDIIWSLSPLSHKAIDAYMKKNIMPRYNIREYTFMLNRKSKCSVPDLWHCHVFWK
jgi:hypothetical protein